VVVVVGFIVAVTVAVTVGKTQLQLELFKQLGFLQLLLNTSQAKPAAHSESLLQNSLQLTTELIKVSTVADFVEVP
jgi:hypothetical protein